MKQKNSNYHVSKTLGEMAQKIEIVNDLQGDGLGSARTTARHADGGDGALPKPSGRLR